MFNIYGQPYEDAPGDYGLQLLDMDVLLNATLESDKSGLQVHVFHLCKCLPSSEKVILFFLRLPYMQLEIKLTICC